MIVISKLIDLTGQRFGKLTVVKREKDTVYPNGKTSARWLCKCDCGNEVIVVGQSLKKELTKSCGCIQKRYNTYDLSGEYGMGYTLKGEKFYFDLEDYDKIKSYCWYLSGNKYLVAGNNNLLLHRLITNCESNMVVDHINHNKMDNRKSNLRICKQSNNSANCKISKNNTSGVTGVTWNKERNKWEARIMVNRKTINLGRYNSFEDAVKARKEAEDKYFGEFSYDNSQKLLQLRTEF